jgi:hypothetical protein
MAGVASVTIGASDWEGGDADAEAAAALTDAGFAPDNEECSDSGLLNNA